MSQVLDDLRERIALPAGLRVRAGGSTMSVCAEVHPFVEPALSEVVGHDSPPDAPVDVHLIEARAAVGKTTLSRWLSNTSGCPVLDLAVVRVAEGSFRGLLPELERVGEDGSHVVETLEGGDGLRSGSLTVIVDAIDEGRLRSGDANIEAFLATTWTELARRTERGARPAVVFLGRPQAIQLVADSLEIFNLDERSTPPLGSRRSRVDFFDEERSRSIVLKYAYAKADEEDNLETLERNPAAVQSLLNTYFDAVGSALSMERDQLWTNYESAQFAGYAPVLELLGRLIGESKNPMLIEASILGDSRRAWSVIENVCGRVFDREAEKMRKHLTGRFGSADGIPLHAYDRGEQVRTAIAAIEGRRIDEKSARSTIAFEAHRRTEYLETVRQWVIEHPFLRIESGETGFSNPILGAIMAAEGLLHGGLDTRIRSVAELGRQGFLWSAMEHRADEASASGEPVPLIEGESMDVIARSFVASEAESNDLLVIQPAGHGAHRVLRSTPGRHRLVLETTSPVRLGPTIESIRAEVDHLIIRGATGGNVSMLGEVSLRCDRLDVQTERVVIGTSADVWIEVGRDISELTGYTSIDLGRALPASPTRLRTAGVLGERPSWSQYHAPGQRGPFKLEAFRGDVVFEFLGLLRRQASIVLTARHQIDDQRLQSIDRASGGRMPEIVKLLKEHRLATEEAINAGGERKVRIRFGFNNLLDQIQEDRTPAWYEGFSSEMRRLLPKP